MPRVVKVIHYAALSSHEGSLSPSTKTGWTMTYTYPDCLRLDVLARDYQSWPNPLDLAGSIWFAPDVGPVLGVARYEGLEVARIELVSREPAQ